MDKTSDSQELIAIMEKLLPEFEQSGLSIDDFIREKLKTSNRPDAEACAEDIIQTSQGIDKAFHSLQESKKEGYNREEWLREEMDSMFDQAQATPKQAGEILSTTTQILNGDSPASSSETEVTPYNGLDAAIQIRHLDDAIVKNTCEDILLSSPEPNESKQEDSLDPIDSTSQLNPKKED